jgi:hypothetical protein
MAPNHDQRLARICNTNSCPELPLALVKAANKMARLLLAARSWSDVGVFTKIAVLPDGRFAAPVLGRWAILFSWDELHSHVVLSELKRL